MQDEQKRVMKEETRRRYVIACIDILNKHLAQIRGAHVVARLLLLVMVLPMAGSIGGFWVHVAANQIDEMISDYVPCNQEGQPICVSQGKNGYWNFHLPGKRTIVSFHRQLWRDLNGGTRLPRQEEINHKDRNRNNNRSQNLDCEYCI